MFVVVVFHLLGMVVMVVAAGDVSGASHWPTGLSDPPGVPPFHQLSASARASLCWTHYAHGSALQWKCLVGELGQEAPLPGSRAAMVKDGMRVGERRSQPGVTLSRSIQPPGAGHTAPRGGSAQLGTTDWGLAQDTVRPGCNAWELLCQGEGEEGSLPNGHAVSQRAGGNCVAMASVRPVAVVGELEPMEPAADYCRYSSYAADVRKQPEGEARSSHRLRGERSGSVATRVRPEGSGPGLPRLFQSSPPGRCWRC